MRRLALIVCLLAVFGSVESRNPRGFAVSITTGSTVINFGFVPPTQNTDNSSITTGEVTGYELGLRTGGSAGTYPTVLALEKSTTSFMLSTQIIPALATGSYSAAVRTTGPTQSAWSTESTFTIN